MHKSDTIQKLKIKKKKRKGIFPSLTKSEGFQDATQYHQFIPTMLTKLCNIFPLAETWNAKERYHQTENYRMYFSKYYQYKI